MGLIVSRTELKKTEAALKSALAKAEIASQSKDNFLANMRYKPPFIQNTYDGHLTFLANIVMKLGLL